MMYNFQFANDRGGQDTVPRFFAYERDAIAHALVMAGERQRTVKLVGGSTIGVVVVTPSGPQFLDASRLQDAENLRDMKRWDGLPLPLFVL